MKNNLIVTSNITKKELDLTQPLIISILVEGQTDWAPEETSTCFAILAKYDGEKFTPQNEKEQNILNVFPSDIAIELTRNFDGIVKQSLKNEIFSINTATIQTSIETEESIAQILIEDQYKDINSFSKSYFDKYFSSGAQIKKFYEFVDHITQFITATQLQNRSENEYSKKQLDEIDEQLTSMRNIIIGSLASNIGHALYWNVNGEQWTPKPVERISRHINEALSMNMINDGKKFIVNKDIKSKIYSDLQNLIYNDKALNYGLLLNRSIEFSNNYQKSPTPRLK